MHAVKSLFFSTEDQKSDSQTRSILSLEALKAGHTCLSHLLALAALSLKTHAHPPQLSAPKKVAGSGNVRGAHHPFIEGINPTSFFF